MKGLGVFVALLLAPAVSAQFGTQILPGDPDAPLALAAASIAVQVNESDFGESGPLYDNCLILDTGSASAGAQNLDFRLTPCFREGNGYLFRQGTFILDNAVAEHASPYPQANGATAENVLYGDANGNNVYDAGDAVFVVASTSTTGLAPGTQTGQWVIRLTPYGGFEPGTFVFPGHPDMIAFGASAKLMPASIGYVEQDNVAGLSVGDFLYLLPVAPGAAAGSAVPAGSVRLAFTPPPPPEPPAATTTTESAPTTTSESQPLSSSATTTTRQRVQVEAAAPAIIGLMAALAFAASRRR